MQPFAAVPFPVPREKVLEVSGGVFGDAFADIGKPSLGVDVVQFCCLYRRPDYAELRSFSKDSG